MVTIWSNLAIAKLFDAYDYIVEDSPKNADNVKKEIFKLADDLSRHPEKFPPDKYKLNNNKDWRVFEKYRYRVSYRIISNGVEIVRLRHTSKLPVFY